jgi:putative FmdB family regulatory protein
MPSYDYQCQENDHIYTETRSITEEQKVTECPECGADLKRIFEATPTVFRAPGFYANERKREFGL